SSIDQQKISFTILKSAGKAGEVWAVGHLQAVDAQSTRIVGVVGIPAYEIIFLVAMFGILGIIFVPERYLSSGPDSALFVALVVALVVTLMWGILIGARESLITDLRV
ncbi:MAG: hypothetical protein OIN84_12580, partial [Candidatus Methanoperedens sp.]|nr:hypothetical protein [Candidatus Methanoperedens sp.]